MAIWLRKSRSIILHNYLKTRIGLLGIDPNLQQRSLLSSLFHCSRINGVNQTTEAAAAFPARKKSSSPTLLISRCFKSVKAGEQVDSHEDVDEDEYEIQALDFPGGRVPLTSEMNFIAESPEKRVNCYRVLDDNGHAILSSRFEQVSKDVAVKMYSAMVTLQMMDTIFYEAQRQGRLSFYITSNGEEAINIASAAALSPDDVVLPQHPNNVHFLGTMPCASSFL